MLTCWVVIGDCAFSQGTPMAPLAGEARATLRTPPRVGAGLAGAEVAVGADVGAGEVAGADVVDVVLLPQAARRSEAASSSAIARLISGFFFFISSFSFFSPHRRDTVC